VNRRSVHITNLANSALSRAAASLLTGSPALSSRSTMPWEAYGTFCQCSMLARLLELFAVVLASSINCARVEWVAEFHGFVAPCHPTEDISRWDQCPWKWMLHLITRPWRHHYRWCSMETKRTASIYPIVDEINALPEKFRQYIHDLEIRCDKSGDVQTIAISRGPRCIAAACGRTGGRD
jgi:hypothetical protein